MPFLSPAAAFSTEFEQQLMNQQEMRRKAQADAMAQQRADQLAKYQEEELRQGREALDEKRREHDETMKDKRVSTFQRRVGDMFMGDTPDASTLKEADELGMGHLFPPDPTNPAVRRYAGTRKEREEKQQRDATLQYAGTLPQGSPERQALEYEARTGKAAPAGMFKPQGTIRLNFNPRAGTYTDVVTNQPATPEQLSDPNAKIERLQEVDPAAAAARDAAAEARKATQLNTVHQQAVSEFDKWEQPIRSQLDAFRDLGIMLNARTPEADKLIAPLVIKGTISGQGSGFRMTRAEIENVVGGRSKWESLQAALNQWQVDPSKALSITDEQRAELRDIAKAIRKKATERARAITDARHKIDDAEDVKTINKARTSLDELLSDTKDDQDEPTQPSGLPAIGSMFNGGKVLAIRPK